MYGQTWKPIGPFNRTSNHRANGQGSGRIKTIAFHPLYGSYDSFLGATNRTVFVGSPFGGIWISRDDGANWSNTDPLNQYPNLTTDFLPGCGVMDIVVDYNSPTTLYASINTTESFGYIPAAAMHIQPSAGIYKYTPSTGWVAKYSYAYNAKKMILQLAIDPANNNIIYGCTSDGIIRSINGGGTWTTVLTAGVDKPFRNVVFDPNNSLIVYASGQDIYKSTNGGATFGAISNFSTLIPSNLGTILSNIVVSSTGNLYASIVYSNQNGRDYVFYKYNGSWSAPLPMFPKTLDWHYDRFPLTLKTVSGVDYVFAGQELLQRYNSSTNTWATISDYGFNMHPDIHDIVFSPSSTSLWVGHDGGVSKTTANFYTSPTWATINKGLNIATLTGFAGAEKNKNLFLVGEIDNGNSYTSTANEDSFNSIIWEGWEMADGGQKSISYTSPNDWINQHTSYAWTNYTRNTTGTPSTNDGSNIFQNFEPFPPDFEDFGAKKPLVQDINLPNMVYRGSNALIRSSDYGLNSQLIWTTGCFPSAANFYSQIENISISPTKPNYLYMVLSNYHSLTPDTWGDKIFKTTDALTHPYRQTNGNCINSSPNCECDNWFDITPPWPSGPTLQQLKQTRILSTVVSSKNPDKIWASFSYSQYTPNYKVWMYNGTSWIDWSAGLPDLVDINYLVLEKGSNDGIYAATSKGIYYRNSNSSMSGWIPYMGNLPHVKVVKLEINYTENTIRAGTLGRGIWKSSLYCPNSSKVVSNCSNCNSLTDDFWEGTNVTVSNTTLNTNKQIIRAVDYIDILPETTLDPTGNANVYYDIFIHGCGPTQLNSYRSQIGIGDEELNEEEPGTENNMIAFPNPNIGLFTLNVEGDNKKNIYVYDLLGKIVYQKMETNEQKLDIDISAQHKGMYIVKVMDGDNIKMLKVIYQ